LLPQLGDDLDFRAPEAVNRLAVVTDRRQLSAIADQQFDQLTLHRINILSFVHNQMQASFGDLLAACSIGFKSSDKFRLRCTEIQKPAASQIGVISGGRSGECLGGRRVADIGGQFRARSPWPSGSLVELTPKEDLHFANYAPNKIGMETRVSSIGPKLGPTTARPEFTLPFLSRFCAHMPRQLLATLRRDPYPSPIALACSATSRGSDRRTIPPC
jgi:hypothetical protein